MTDRNISRRIMIGGVAAGAGLAATAATGDRIVGAASAQTTPKTFVLSMAPGSGAGIGGVCRIFLKRKAIKYSHRPLRGLASVHIC
jgi:hypothetical protein